MTGPTGAGVAVGIASTEAQTNRGGGLSVFNIFPKMLIPVIIYAAVAFLGFLDTELFTIGLPSGDWSLTTADLILIVGLVFLFIEMIQSAGSGTATLLNHGLSMATLLLGILLFLLVPQFATSAFFLLIMMSLMDVVAGFSITAIAARRDLGT